MKTIKPIDFSDDESDDIYKQMEQEREDKMFRRCYNAKRK